MSDLRQEIKALFYKRKYKKQDAVYRVLAATGNAPFGVDPNNMSSFDQMVCLDMLSMLADQMEAGVWKKVSRDIEIESLKMELNQAQFFLKRSEKAMAYHIDRCYLLQRLLCRANRRLVKAGEEPVHIEAEK